MPVAVIKHWNDPNNAITLGGMHVRREKEIWVPTHDAWIPCLPTSMHFCFRDESVPRGSTLFCTCGSFAEIVGYHVYNRFSSFMGNEVIACHNFIQSGVHADGSHE